ncbi:peptidase M15 [Psychromonas sp. psych-6C06]|uniref:M15 family metallopeptidase n=1 Tax=Psychromonas sp. psych-6C06 TaxID=2058089 RepID=UPI000C3228C9|nr:M15 family metallopeptidase [Psychromonas sp. psych-6C06]PKF60660.1 peptidase M15 [Psychromonas sp. psych-6C06]
MRLVELTGQVETHLCLLNKQTLLHHKVRSPFIELQKSAKRAGFNLQIASGFRSFERQKLIWNNKYSGKNKVVDKNENRLDISRISELEKLYAILHWSALPGASRHHWGTDFDIYDPTLLPVNRSLQLINAEYQNGGYFSALSEWLSDNMSQFDFYRPYQHDLGGVAPEPWHISYYPIAQGCLKEITASTLYDLIMENNILGKSLICQQLPMIYEKYICNINSYGK